MDSQHYWSDRYSNENTPWDMVSASPPLTAFLQNLNHRQQKILIPGAGNAYEAEWLWNNGFRNTFVVDVAPEPLKNLKTRVPDFPDSQLLLQDFFKLSDSYDLIVEQTFFCALPPSQRGNYAEKMYELLNPGGSLVGVFFDFPLTADGPPFGGSTVEYRQLFTPKFRLYKLERCYNSIESRSGSELFFRFIKP